MADYFFKSDRGFTLMELIVVIGLIGILAGIGMPYFRGFMINTQLRGAARDLTSDLRYAQQQAVTTQINYRVVFVPSSNSYRVENDSTGQLIRARTVKSPVILQSTTLPANTVIFNATGAALSSGTIILSNEDSQAVIDIKPSGYAQVTYTK